MYIFSILLYEIMYAIYQEAIKKFIIKKMNVAGIQYYNYIPRLMGKYARHYIESCNTNNILLCIEYMFNFLNISCQIKKSSSKSNIYINSGKDVLVMYEYFDQAMRGHMFFLNKFTMRVQETKGLLLFLIDPLDFIRRSMHRSDIKDQRVKSFLIELKTRARNMKCTYVKYWLAMEMDLIMDIKKIVMDQYISLIFNREMVRNYLDEKN